MLEQVQRAPGYDAVVRLVCAGAASEEDYVRKVSSIATAFRTRLAKHAPATEPGPCRRCPAVRRIRLVLQLH